MRDLYDNTLEIKTNLFVDSLSNNNLNIDFINKFIKNYNAINTAKPTEKNLKEDGVYNGYADLYINSTKKFMQEKSEKNYNRMVRNCVQCHEQFCLGAISKINKLYYKKSISN